MPFVTPDDALQAAALELRFLLDRGYPRERCLVLVGDRRRLTSPKREILRRSVMAPARAGLRRRKLLCLDDLKAGRVGLDGHNLLITLESALSGGILARGDDGVVRDIARAGRSYRITGLTGRAVAIILHTLKRNEAAEAHFYLDRPVSYSGRLAEMIREEMACLGLAGTAVAVAVPERSLKPFDGLVASSDGELIEACPRPIDLAGLIITRGISESRIIDFQTG